MSARDRLLDLSRYGARPVLVERDRTLDATAVQREVTRAAAVLVQRGVMPGDRVAWLGPTATQTVVGLLAIAKAGAVAVPLSPRHTPAELAHVIDASEARLVVVDEAVGARAIAGAVSAADIFGATGEHIVDVPRDDAAPALLIYTSGTTGKSKGAALPWRAVVGNMTALGAAWGLGPDDACALMLPLFHVHGLCIGVVAMLLAGVTVHLHAKLDCDALVADVRDGVTVWLGVPTMYALLLDHLERHPDDAGVLARARLFTSGSAPLPVRDLERFERATGHRILERYGMTETLITLTNPLVGERVPGHVGHPVPGVTCRIVDEAGDPVADGEPGELHVRGDSLMLGYWRNPEATAAASVDGWFRTGDVAQRGPGGSIRIVGRTSTDIIKSGGFKISALEIEEVLRRVASITDVAVLGIEDPTWGERVAAVVVISDRSEIDDVVATSSAACADALADYKRPRLWLVVDALPRNAMGKLSKPALRDRIRDELAAHGPFVARDLRAAHASSGRPPA